MDHTTDIPTLESMRTDPLYVNNSTVDAAIRFIFSNTDGPIEDREAALGLIIRELVIHDNDMTARVINRAK